MRVGVVGGGIVGWAIAATINKHSPSTQVSLIDDKRPNQTSKAGQGYLWSIHRCSSHDRNRNNDIGSDSGRQLTSLEYSLEAKDQWMQLLGHDSTQGLLEKQGSLLIASRSSKDNLLEYFDLVKDSLGSDVVAFLDDASSCNKVLLPSICGIHYKGDDYVTTPSLLIDALMEMYDVECEHRTVHDLESEKKKYDYVICSTGSWIDELNPNLGVRPIRGVLLDVLPTGNEMELQLKQCTPMMEFGYGSLGVHFTLSSRGGKWLLGASREEVSFSTDNVDGVIDKLMMRSKEYLHDGVLGEITSRKIGFRPSCIERKGDESPFRIKCVDGVIFCYGFEGQGVLYAALAAKKVLDHLSLPRKS